ncbi:MAG: hypothetical protein SPG97_02400 [Bacilli bacterium]|nr:hypothetical protein [Bacilli bacterium]
MSNSIAPGSSADVNVKVTALTTNLNVPVTYKTIILKKNLVNGANTLTQEMMSTTNTKYVIKYDYVLGEDITMPENCILEFDGGNISGAYTITGTNTCINASLVKIFNTNVTLTGTFKNGEWNVEWFGTNGNGLNNNIYINYAIEQLNNIGGGDLIFSQTLTISDTIYLLDGVSLIGKTTTNPVNTSYQTGGTLIRCAFQNKDSWVVSVKADNAVNYNVFDIKDSVSVRLTGIRIERLTFLLVNTDGSYISDLNNTEAIFGGIRLCTFDNAVIKNVMVFGVKYGISLTWAWCSSIEDSYVYSTACGLVLTSTITTLYLKNCRFRKAPYYKIGDKDFDISLFRDSNTIVPPYLTTNDVKSIGLIADGFVGHYGPNAQLDACTFEGWDISIVTIEGEWLINNMYNEAIQKSYVWSCAKSMLINNEACDISKGIPIVENGYEYGTTSNIVFIGHCPVGRCYPSKTGMYHIKPTNIVKISFYDNYVYNQISGKWEFTKNPNKKIEIPYHVNTIKTRSDTYAPVAGKLITPSTGLGIEEAVLFGITLIDKINYLSKDKKINIYRQENKVANWANPNPIENKEIIINTEGYTDNDSVIYVGEGFPIKNSSLIYTENKKLQATSGGAFHVYGKCSIDVYYFLRDYQNPQPVCKLCGEEPIDLSVNFRNTEEGIAYMTQFNFRINDDTFEYPYKISVYQNHVLAYYLTNTRRPTKGVPIGYVYIENGVPIYYTGDISDGKSGWVNATGTPV